MRSCDVLRLSVFMKCVTAEEERKLKIAVEHGFTTWAEYEAEEERQRKAEEERTRKEAVEKPARGLSPWLQKRQEAPLTPGNVSVPEWQASVGLDEATVAEAVRVLGLGGC